MYIIPKIYTGWASDLKLHVYKYIENKDGTHYFWE